jgi:imidazolonepropionase-like amidohydrolase
LDDKIGTIEEGKVADIVALEGNPLEDIAIFRNKSRIKLVMRSGEILIRRK